jgi:hypothetical protein
VRLLVAALLLACLVLLLLVVGVLLTGAGPVSARDRRAARWSAVNTGGGGQTTVAVLLASRKGRVLESRTVEVIDDTDPDYEARLLEAMAQARSRAEVLNLELR